MKNELLDVEYRQALIVARLSVIHKKMNAFDASEIVGALFPQLTLEAILDDLLALEL
mgnify:CR=1 FL=1|tara:strand:+ start:41094 stop:41264 length:171 start_codon:yes stop_codon:yes gene_type:complete